MAGEIRKPGTALVKANETTQIAWKENETEIAYAIPKLDEAQEEQIRQALEARHSPGTRDAYKNAWEHFKHWCVTNNFDSLPAHPKTITLYLTELAKKGKSISYIRVVCGAIGYEHKKMWPGNTPPTKAPAVGAVIEGLRKTYGKPPTKKEPIVDAVLERIVTAFGDLSNAPWEHRLCLTLILVGRATAMRRSELVNIRMADVHEHEDGFVFVIPKSKGDQTGEGQEVGINYIENEKLCGAFAFKRWLEYAKPIDYVFRHENGKPVTGKDVASAVKLGIALLTGGSEEENKKMLLKFSGHSLRSGHITQGDISGVPHELLQRQARHKHIETTQGYMKKTSVAKNNSSMYLGKPKKT